MPKRIDEPGRMSLEILDAEHGLDAMKEAAKTGRPLAPVWLSMPDGSLEWRFLLLADADAVTSVPPVVALIEEETGATSASWTVGQYLRRLDE